MKNKIFKFILGSVLALGTLVFSCKDSFLNVVPTGQLNTNTLTNKIGIDGLLVGTYAVLVSNANAGTHAGFDNWLWGSILGGDANKGSNPGDQAEVHPISRFEALPTNRFLLQPWSSSYEGISRANRTLTVLNETSEISESDKAKITGELRFLRGLYHFNLKQNFENIPYIDETVNYGTGIDKVSNQTDAWLKIEEDFKAAMNSLPETQKEIGRANKWAAASMLAKTYLFQHKYNEAKALFDQIIANGVTTAGQKYTLYPNYAGLFDASNDNNAEIIFGAQAAANTGSANNANPSLVLNFPYNGGPAGCCGFNQPSFDLASSFRTTVDGLPMLDKSYRLAENELKSDFGLQSSEPFTVDDRPVDPRIDFSIGRRGVPYLDWGPHPGNSWVRDYAYGGPYAPKKFVFPKAQQGTLTDGSSWTAGYTAINYAILRYADLLLMAAEAEIEVGSLEKAREYVNMIRKRAMNETYFVKNGTQNAANYKIGLYTKGWASKEAASTAVRFERKLELSGEGKRFYDLVRWGIADQELNEYIQFEAKRLPITYGGAKFTKGRNERLPIPQSQIDNQGADVLKQNPGY